VRFHKLGCADEAVGLENSVEPWIASMWPALLQIVGGGATGDASVSAGEAIVGTATPCLMVFMRLGVQFRIGGDQNLKYDLTVGKTRVSITGEKVSPPPAPEVTVPAAKPPSGAEAQAPKPSAEAAVSTGQEAAVSRGGPACKASGVRWMADVVAEYEGWRAQAMGNTQAPPVFEMQLEVRQSGNHL
jgi:hypothetical protein